MADAGWYPDPSGEGGHAYWDGQRWTGDRRPAAPAASEQQAGPWGPAAPVDQTQRIDRGTLPAEPQQIQQQGQQQGQPWAAQGGWGQQGQQQPGEAYRPGPAPTQSWPQPGEQPGAPMGAPPVGAPPMGAQPGWQQPRWDEPAPRRRSRTPFVIAAAAVVVLLVAGLITWLAWPDDAPSLTYDGKEIASASTTLSTAEKSVRATVAKRHGTSNGDTRCYYAQATDPPKGQKKSDIEQALRCGPVLFVDGDRAREYLSVPVSGKASGSKVELTPSSPLGDLQPQAVGTDLKLTRPDKKTPPAGSGGLSVPTPPAASSTLLAVAGLGPTAAPSSPGDSAVMVGRDTKVTLRAAGYIDRYGQGDDARSAPAGKKLVAFRVAYDAGDVDGSTPARAELVVDGQARELPDSDSSDWIVAAVPSSGAQLQLDDGGFTQTLSVPDGKPGSKNIAVLRRQHRVALLVKSFNVPVHLQRSDGATGNTNLHTRTKGLTLDFWAQQNSSVHPSSPDNALLALNPLFTVSGSSTEYGFDPSLVKLRVPGGRLVSARNIASDGKIFNVFEVPAGFTSGVLVISGSEKLGRIKLSVRKAYSLAVSIPAG